jgi:hypothetical protein
MILIIGRAIVSWVSADPRNGIVRFLVQATDPPDARHPPHAAHEPAHLSDRRRLPGAAWPS